MSIVQKMVSRQARNIGGELPVLPTTDDLRIAADLLIQEGILAMHHILETEEDPNLRIKATNAATNISRYILAREVAERDSDGTKLEIDDDALVIGSGIGTVISEGNDYAED